jgi:hypothetical protein
MSSPRLSIRVDVDVEHARQVLEGHFARVGASGAAAVPPSRGALANIVRALRERLRHDVAAAYPDARVVVTMWRKEPKARATKVRVGHRTADALAERRCALIAEHVDALRAATIDAMRMELAAAPLLGSSPVDDVLALPTTATTTLLASSDGDPPDAVIGDGTLPPA